MESVKYVGLDVHQRKIANLVTLKKSPLKSVET